MLIHHGECRVLPISTHGVRFGFQVQLLHIPRAGSGSGPTFWVVVLFAEKEDKKRVRLSGSWRKLSEPEAWVSCAKGSPCAEISVLFSGLSLPESTVWLVRKTVKSSGELRMVSIVNGLLAPSQHGNRSTLPLLGYHDLPTIESMYCIQSSVPGLPNPTPKPQVMMRISDQRVYTRQMPRKI